MTRFSAWVLLLILALTMPAAGQVPDSFRFVHITDTHLTAAANMEPLQQLVGQLNAMTPRPAFVVDTGDVTEAGRPEEFERFKQGTSGLSVPFYTTTGNHDTRWSPDGKEGFKKAFGRLYHSFDHNGAHFVLLDSSMMLEHWGHFDRAQLKWLENDLKRVRKEAPIFLFFHHWIGREPRMVDNEEELLRIIAPHNVAAIFVGHGHSDIEWKVNGIPCFMARGLYQGSYNLVEVGPEETRVLRVRKEENWQPNQAAAFKTNPGRRPRIAFGWDDANFELLARRMFLAELRRDEKEVIKEKGVRAEYAIDDGEFQMMPPDERSVPGRSAPPNRFVARFETRGMTPGSHRVRIRMTAPDGEVYRREEVFVFEKLEGLPKRAWESETEDAVQSSVHVADDMAYAASHDGKVYALELEKGRRRWTFTTRGPIVASPLVAEGGLYIGSTDGIFYALDGSNGRVRWRFDSGSPIFATAAVSNGVVCFGGNRKIYGLDTASGRLRWTVEAGSFFQSRAAASDGVFYLGGWDNALYAVEAASGAVRWKNQMGRSRTGALSFYYSPAIASPAVGQGRVYICTNDGHLRALNAATGKEEWAVRAPEGRDTFGYSSPLFANGRVYAGGLGKNGDCYAVDASSGRILWRTATGAENYDSSPQMGDGLIVIGSVRGTLFWLDAESGELRHQYNLDPGHLFGTPALSEKAAHVGSMNGTIYRITLP